MEKSKITTYVSSDGVFHAEVEDVFVQVIINTDPDPGGTVTINGECPRCEHWSFTVNSCARQRGLMKFALKAFITKLGMYNTEACETCREIVRIWAEQVEKTMEE